MLLRPLQIALVQNVSQVSLYVFIIFMWSSTDNFVSSVHLVNPQSSLLKAYLFFGFFHMGLFKEGLENFLGS